NGDTEVKIHMAQTLPALILDTFRRSPQVDFLNYPEPDGGWRHVSTAEAFETIRNLALGLTDLGVTRGERVGLISPPSPEWVIADLAIQSVGGVTVPIFKKISPESFRHEVSDSGMRYLFVGYPEEIPMAVEQGRDRAEIITFGCCTDNERFQELLRRGAEIAEEAPERYQTLVNRGTADELCTIIYTSGSTGLPKGVELTQANLLSQISGAAARFTLHSDRDAAISLLPLAHIFERMVVYFYLTTGVPVYFVDNPKLLTTYAPTVRPTVMTVVPRLLEKVNIKMNDKAAATPGIAGRIAQAAIARAETRPVDGRTTLLDRIFDRLVYRKFRAALGGHLHTMISGSAKLAPELARFFINVGLPVYEGYGMTESSPVIAANYPGHRKVGTVGPLFPDIQVKIADDGEILVRGPNVMRGYHNRPDATADTIQDGWLHTGDLGSIDADGYLTVSGRKKELFKKSSGEYVPPVPIERAISEHPVVDTAVIFADNRVYVTALIFPDMEKVQQIREERGFAAMTDAEYLASRHLRDELQEHIDEMNTHLHHCEQVIRFEIMDHAASIETGELTPTMKVRRGQVEEMYHDRIEEMYQQIGGSR
ncbi:MAG: AMP-dependent synthetase/ligase, partial [Alkalispirochaeta sp.]